MLARERLSRWLARREVSQVEFSRVTGIDQSLLSKYLSGSRLPKAENRIAIEKATAGEITVEMWSAKKRAA